MQLFCGSLAALLSESSGDGSSSKEIMSPFVNARLVNVVVVIDVSPHFCHFLPFEFYLNSILIQKVGIC